MKQDRQEMQTLTKQFVYSKAARWVVGILLLGVFALLVRLEMQADDHQVIASLLLGCALSLVLLFAFQLVGAQSAHVLQQLAAQAEQAKAVDAPTADNSTGEGGLVNPLSAELLESCTQQLLDSLPQSIYWKDADLRYIGCNRAYLRSLGLSNSIELVGKTDEELPQVDRRLLASADLDRRVLQGQQPPIHVIKKRTLPSGSDIWLDITKLPMVDAGGAIVGVISSLEDLTARKHAEDAVRRSDTRYRSLFDASQDALLIIYGDLIVDCNATAANWLGVSRDELLGATPMQLDEDRGMDEESIWLESLARCNNPLTSELVSFAWTFRGGTEPASCEVSLVPIEVSDQRFVLASIRDISDRVKAESDRLQMLAKLERAKRMESLAVLAGGVAHDLNNMLGPLVAYPDLILEQLPEYCHVKEDILTMKSAAEEAAAVINDLLTLARRGRYEMKPLFPNDIAESFRRSITCKDLIKRHPAIQFAWELQASDCAIVGSESHLSKVLMNLMVNACDAMPNGGRLIVATRQVELNTLSNGYSAFPHGPYVELAVSDTGTGIAPDDLQKIFEPYFSKKTMGHASGSGLGLAIVYGVVKDHGGYYDIKTEVGVGTTFSLYFPLSIVKPLNGRIETTLVGGKESILLVDDSAEQRDLAVRILKSLGYQITVAASVAQALTLFAARRFDLVILDMLLGETQDGLDLYRAFRKMHADQLAILVTGYSPGDRVAAAIAEGASSCLRKPFTRDQLAGEVRRAIDQPQSQLAAAELPQSAQQFETTQRTADKAVCSKEIVHLDRYARRTDV